VEVKNALYTELNSSIYHYCREASSRPPAVPGRRLPYGAWGSKEYRLMGLTLTIE